MKGSVEVKVSEIFSSIEGEGKRAGQLCTFIRLVGCNLRCSYCDTAYSYEGGEELDLEEIMALVRMLGNRCVTITGGEPLIHPLVKRLISLLLSEGFEVNIETNGSVDLKDFYSSFPRLFFTMDYKCPSSGMEYGMIRSNIKRLESKDVLKFVVGTQEDLEAARSIIIEYEPRAQVYLSPVFKKLEPSKIVEFLQKAPTLFENTKVQLQLHKFIWDPDQRGV